MPCLSRACMFDSSSRPHVLCIQENVVLQTMLQGIHCGEQINCQTLCAKKSFVKHQSGCCSPVPCANSPLNELGEIGYKNIIFLGGQPRGDEGLPAQVFNVQVDHASSADCGWGGLRQVLHLKQNRYLQSKQSPWAALCAVQCLANTESQCDNACNKPGES